MVGLYVDQWLWKSSEQAVEFNKCWVDFNIILVCFKTRNQVQGGDEYWDPESTSLKESGWERIYEISLVA